MISRATSTRWINNLKYNQIKSKLTFNNNNVLTNHSMNDFGYRHNQGPFYKQCKILQDILEPLSPAQQQYHKAEGVTHVINIVKELPVSVNNEGNIAPAILVKAQDKLFSSLDLEVNIISRPVNPVIFDTGASLAITGHQQDFLPNSFKATQQLKLGGMASGVSITGVGNVAWTFQCQNNDQLTVITKCYLVPSTNTRLLSPQSIFDKQNGHQGRFWGDEEQFHLEYENKPAISVGYSQRSNLPIGYTIVGPHEDEVKVNLALLSEDNQNLTAG